MKNIKIYMLCMVCMLMVSMMVGCGSKTNEEVMLDIYKKDGYDKASEYIDTVEDFSERIDLIYALGAEDAGVSKEEFKKILDEYETEEDLCDNVEVVDEIVSGGRASGKDLTIVLKNNTGKTLDYVKVDIFYYDKDGNLKDTAWTNKSGTFLDGGEFRLETYMDVPLSVTQYKVEVSEVSVK